MTFLTSILLGMCMGSGAAFSIWYGQKDRKRLKEGMVHAFGLIAAVTVVLNIIVFACLLYTSAIISISLSFASDFNMSGREPFVSSFME